MSMTNNGGNEFCGICTKRVEEFGCQAYGCELCPKWIHALCLFPNASASELDTLFKYNTGFDVRCRSCKQEGKRKSENMVNEIYGIKEQLMVYNRKITELQGSLQEPSGNLTESTIEVIENTCADIAKKHSLNLLTEAKASSEKVIKQEFAAMEKRLTVKEERLRNIIISGIPENRTETLKSTVLSVCMNLEPQFQECDLLNCTRLGRPNLNNKHRVVLARLRLHLDAQFMHQYGRGRSVELGEVGKIWINPDLSKLEREVLYKNKLKKRNKKTQNDRSNKGDSSEKELAVALLTNDEHNISEPQNSSVANAKKLLLG